VIRGSNGRAHSSEDDECVGGCVTRRRDWNFGFGFGDHAARGFGDGAGDARDEGRRDDDADDRNERRARGESGGRQGERWQGG